MRLIAIAELCLLSMGSLGCQEKTRPTAESRDSAADAGPCAPDDARGEGPCEMVVSVLWDGHRCGATSGCSCVGRDCKRWRNLPECEAAHAGCSGK